MRSEKVTVERLRELLEYRDGKLYRKTSRGGYAAGSEAFTADKGDGYRIGSVDGVLLRRNRVVFALHHGCWPEGFVDHIDRDPSNDRIENLREVTARQNCMNKVKAKGKRLSKWVGVTFDKQRGLWVGQVQHRGKAYNLPRQRCQTAVMVARVKLARELRGDAYVPAH